MIRFLLIFLSLYLFHFCVFSQGSDIYRGGIRIPVGHDSSKYIRIALVQQFWLRSIENNPGTIDASGDLAERSSDIGSRRTRVTMYSQISPRFLVFAQFGINNQTFINGGAPGQGAKKPQLFFHDAWTEFTVVPERNYSTNKANLFSLSLGAGLHFWNGVSRLGSPSIGSFLTLDLPVFNFVNVERTDQFGRQYGIYAKGMAGPIHYRLHLNKPFVDQRLGEITTERASNVATENWSVGGYAAHQFLEKEGILSPFRIGSYLGTKRVFNIGAGFYHHPKASGTLGNPGSITDFNRHNQTVWAVDAFLDHPLGEQGMAVTAYSVLFNYDYGPNYFRTVGIMNLDSRPADPSVSLAGYGNTEPLLGTGQIWMSQLGLLLPANWLATLGRFQPFVQTEYKNLDYLDDTFTNLDAGFNWFIEGQVAKLTLQYGTRPIFIEQNDQRTQTDTKGQWTLQVQIAI
ncbi:porin [Tunicatimonas pelagia]|uniref:porin n=1 Tax=Tunicatimonas pelagia TaxID=931531 RepID=UPI002666B2CE|nr:porin [Tunicatimonas pelagia]WKN46214.1 porin [Tunicatimonas pelagia]